MTWKFQIIVAHNTCSDKGACTWAYTPMPFTSTFFRLESLLDPGQRVALPPVYRRTGCIRRAKFCVEARQRKIGKTQPGDGPGEMLRLQGASSTPGPEPCLSIYMCHVRC